MLVKSKMINKLVLLTAVIMSAVFSSCEQDEVPTPSGETGYMAVSLNVFNVESIPGNSSGRVSHAPNLGLNDFGLTIYQQGTNNIVLQYAVGQIPSDTIEIMEGAYTAVLDNEKDADITIGHYSGSLDFSIQPQQATDVNVTVDLQEVYFQFTLPAYFYITHHITVDNASGPVVVADQANPYTELYLPTLATAQSYDFAVVNNQSGSVIGTSSIVSDTKGKGYNLTITQLQGEGLFSVTVAPIVVEDEPFTPVPTQIEGFTGYFDGANWTSTNNGSATGYQFSPTALSFDCPSGGGGFTSTITVPDSGAISFDYELIIRTSGQYGDRIAYSVNGVETRLSVAGNANGTVSVPVAAGDSFQLSTWGTTQSSSYYGSFSNFVFTY
ncbi:DUF4493 domain-containing protein [Marinoscillum furvescens]|uniref:Uncharacterized protein DUF4493 n=1 Tax=Marinoscillum furvescens DSM 4134 TaxID=1122208 RepID=A0A3D9L0T1_MARFU|nr:DUF4493 domain-containing protein [Marinoscillum furvescens]RED97054.1 uncharacterized protein DUF4493 [Marinoscillum furvescens DSM 4134]